MTEEVVKVDITLNTASATASGGGGGGGPEGVVGPENNFVTHEGSLVKYDWANFGLITYKVPE